VEFREYAKSDAGHQGLVDAAKAMAMTGIDVLTDADLRKRMKDEFDGL
jgi:ABC-type proline/glycine betaine transport system permease subunit